MTLKYHKNHYNVKLLKGYGFSINVRDNKLVFKDTHDPFSEPKTEEHYITNLPYEKIVLSGKGYISTEALGLLCEHNRNLILCDTYGKPISYLNPVMESSTATKYRMAQYDTFRNPEKRNYLAKQIVKAKLESQIRFLESLKRDDSKQIISYLKKSLLKIDSYDAVKIEAESDYRYLRKCMDKWFNPENC